MLAKCCFVALSQHLLLVFYLRKYSVIMFIAWEYPLFLSINIFLRQRMQHPERIPNGSRTKRSSGSWFSRLFLDWSSIVSRSIFVRPSMVLRSTIVHPSFSLRSFFDCRTKIYRRSIEEIANSKRSYYWGATEGKRTNSYEVAVSNEVFRP